MSDIVKVAAQIDVYDTCFLLNNYSGHPLDRFMSCPPMAYTVRASGAGNALWLSRFRCRAAVIDGYQHYRQPGRLRP
jgi:hypothetical protein